MSKINLLIGTMAGAVAVGVGLACLSPTHATVNYVTNTEGYTYYYGMQYVSVVLPDGWSIMEYTDNDYNNAMLMPSPWDYKGLAEFEIYNASDELMFSYAAIASPTGFTPSCDYIYMFADSSESEAQDQIDFCTDEGATVTVIDLSAQSYTEVTLMGLTMRRIGTTYYRDSSPDTTTFDPLENMGFYRYQTTLYELTQPETYMNYMAWIHDENSPSDPDLSDLDNVLDSISANPVPLYRFWSNSKKGHFYTVNAGEQSAVASGSYGDWQYEGEGYNVWAANNCDGRSQVYRFWSNSKRGHFYTISASERDAVRTGMYGDWQYEGVAFCAQTLDQTEYYSMPVFRFWSNSKKHHFYTMNEAEKNAILTGMYGDWQYEGIAYYAEPSTI